MAHDVNGSDGKTEELGSEQTKNTLVKHGAQEPFFGVKVGDMKKLVKFVKKDRELALALYETGNTDAMYLAGLSIDPKSMTKQELQNWAKHAYWYMLADTQSLVSPPKPLCVGTSEGVAAVT